MNTLPHLAGLEGLFDLDRRGIDIRPTLLRVITDQYLQSANHTPDEERQFTELALRLLAETDVATRAAVAARLAHHASAPRSIISSLARDVLDVAEPILRHSPCLGPSDLAEISAKCGPAYALLIAKRVGSDSPLDPERPPETSGGSIERDRLNIEASELPSRDADAVELCELFFTADPQVRRLILVNLEYSREPPARLPCMTQRADIFRIEAAALQHNTEGVVRELERALDIARAQARRIVEDAFGEPIVVAARAMEMPPEILQRMLLFMNPRVGQSVGRVYELAALYNEITIDAARRLVAIWRAGAPAAGPSQKGEPPAPHASELSRRSELTRRAPARPDAAPRTPPRISSTEPV